MVQRRGCAGARAAWLWLAVASFALGSTLVAGAATAGVTWTNVAEEVGVNVRTAGEIHPSDAGAGSGNWPAFPELVGPGACFADFDGDGYQDLYIVTQQYNWYNPAYGDWAREADPHNVLLLNDGEGGFVDFTAQAGGGIDSRAFGYGCSAADYDGDGCIDLFVTNFGVPGLYRNNCDGTFQNVTAQAGFPTAQDHCGEYLCMSTSSAWADYDLDGDLDLYAANFVETNLTDLVHGPNLHIAQVNWLWRNNGDGTFTEVGAEAGVQGNPIEADGSTTLGVVWFDYDLDGDFDLFNANDANIDDFWVNHGDGTFHNANFDARVADPRAGMGVTTGDYDGDGYPDLFFTHFMGEHNGFYRNRGDGKFEDRSGEDGLQNDWFFAGWGAAFFDFDRDGDLDLISINGHAEPGHDNYDQSAQVWRNDPPKPGKPAGDRTWVEVTSQSGPGITEGSVGRGAAFADYDLDGDTDIVVVSNANQTARVLRASGQENQWLRVEMQQPGMNRFGVGARVVLEAAGVKQYREVQAGSSYLSQNDMALDFGLGALAQADSITVHWPGGGSTVVTGVAANQSIRIDRASGAYAVDNLAPRTKAHLEGTAGNGGWWRSTVTATLSAADRGVSVVSGLAGTEWALGDGPWRPYAGETASFGEGVGLLRGRSLDLAGNQEPRRTTAVRVDLTAPTAAMSVAGTPGLKGWWASPSVEVTLEGRDALSGVREVRYRLDDGAWAVYGGPFTVAGDAVHLIAWEAEDVAGNVASGSFEVKVDHTPPEVRVANPKNGTLHLGAQQLANLLTGPAFIVATPALGPVGGPVFLAAADATDATSGVARVDFLLNGSLQAADAAAPYEWAWDTRASPAGAYLLRTAAFDEAGNRNASQVRVVLAGATPEGLLATLQRGPSLNLGLGPLTGGLPLPFLVALAMTGWAARGRRWP